MIESLQRGVEDQIRRIGLLEIRRHEQGGRAASLNLGHRCCAFARVASCQDEAFGASAGDRVRDG
jgi:hypothetical protein